MFPSRRLALPCRTPTTWTSSPAFSRQTQEAPAIERGPLRLRPRFPLRRSAIPPLRHCFESPLHRLRGRVREGAARPATFVGCGVGHQPNMRGSRAGGNLAALPAPPRHSSAGASPMHSDTCPLPTGAALVPSAPVCGGLREEAGRMPIRKQSRSGSSSKV